MKRPFAMLLLLALPVYGQGKSPTKNTIWVGNMELQLGVSKQLVMSRLAEGYKLAKVGTEGDSWLVESKNAPVIYGQVGFKNDKLDFASRDWTNGDEDSFTLVQDLYGALDQFGNEDRHTCYVDTRTSRTPTVESRSITLFCGAKRLVISTSDILSGEYKGRSTDIKELLLSSDVDRK
jgi:hypothetical protein